MNGRLTFARAWPKSSCARFEQEARTDEIRSGATVDLYLLADGGHWWPIVENMRDVVPARRCEVFLLKEGFVADLDAVIPTGRKLAENGIEGGDETATMLEVARVELRELEVEQTNFGAVWLHRREESLAEKVGIQKEPPFLAVHGAAGAKQNWQ